MAARERERFLLLLVLLGVGPLQGATLVATKLSLSAYAYTVLRSMSIVHAACRSVLERAQSIQIQVGTYVKTSSTYMYESTETESARGLKKE